nr:heparan-alpha-glucosaminide N-acetyltransferase domain-containing protein [Candidatus Sigynarchaeum springense]
MTSPPRFKFLDFMKGLAIVLILWVHLALWWKDGTWISIRAFATIFFMRPFGPANFIFVSIFGFLLSAEIREKDGDKKAFQVRMIKRSLVFLGIGSILNLINLAGEVFNPAVPFAASLLRVLLTCNIFTFLGLAQMVIYVGRRLHPAIQVALAASIFATYYLVLNAFTAECRALGVDYTFGDLSLSQIASPVALLYFLLMFENSMSPLVPYIALVFIVNAVYRNLIKMLAVPAASIQLEKVKAEMRRIAVVSTLMTCTGIIMGITPSPGAINQMEYLDLVHADAFRVWDPTIGGFPLFLQPANPSYVLYSFGIVSLLELGGTWVVDLHPRKRAFVDFLATFGSYSLTVFITHAVAALFPLNAGFLAFMALYGAVALFYMGGIWYWDKKIHGKCSLEWLIKQFLAGDVIRRIKQFREGKHDGGGDVSH